MKNSKRIFTLLLTAILLISMFSVGGTLAYLFTKTETITNTFELDNITYALNLVANPPTGYTDAQVTMPVLNPTSPHTTDAGSVDFALNKVPVLVGYEFTGWYEDAEAKELLVQPSDLTIEVGYNEEPAVTNGGQVSLTVYAGWKKKEIKVSFDLQDDKLPKLDDKTVVYDEEYGELPVPERDGYTFLGWTLTNASTDTNYVTEDTIVKTAVDHTLYAQWEARTYYIRYHANGGEGVMPDQKITYDVPTDLSKNLFTKADYSFMGWSLSAESDVVKYIDEQTVTNLLFGGYLDLYAVWDQDTHTVRFDYNGGTGSPASKQFQNGKEYGQLPEYPVHPTKVISANEVMTYLFTGWYTAPTGGTRVYASTIANTAEDHTLYAHWEEAPSNNVIQNMIVKNNPDDNKDGVVDDLYLEFTCTSTFEKYNIPLSNLIPGQTYKLTYTASNDASFGDYESGYRNSVYGSYILANSALTGGRIESNYKENEYVAQVLADWNSRVEPDGVNDGSQSATNDSLLQGPWKNKEIVFTAKNSTMYWTWDFGLMQDHIQNNYNITDIVLEPVAPKIDFAKKTLLKPSVNAKIVSQTNSTYATNFVFDGDGGCETIYYPITGLTAGTKYTITFDHKFTGALINSVSYDYGCGIMNEEPAGTAMSAKMDSLGTFASNKFIYPAVTNSTESVTLTFTATGNTAYWVWNMANCSDSTNGTVDIKVTKFGATHSGGGSITYYPAN